MDDSDSCTHVDNKASGGEENYKDQLCTVHGCCFNVQRTNRTPVISMQAVGTALNLLYADVPLACPIVLLVPAQ